jgi:hypothetical protein
MLPDEEPVVLIIPYADCQYCHGEGIIREHHPYGSTTATEELYCDCVLSQLPEDYDGGVELIHQLAEAEPERLCICMCQDCIEGRHCGKRGCSFDGDVEDTYLDDEEDDDDEEQLDDFLDEEDDWEDDEFPEEDEW